VTIMLKAYSRLPCHRPRLVVAGYRDHELFTSPTGSVPILSYAAMSPKPHQTPWEDMAREQPTVDLSTGPASPAEQGTKIGGKPSPPPPGASAPAVAPPPALAPALAPPPALAMPTSDRCRVCGAPLASDQRYCVECGERRGAARFALPTPGPAVDSATTSRRVRRRPRMTPSATLIAGVATLLLAMGVGVLIGQLGNNGATQRGAALPSVHVTVGAGGSGTGATTNASAGGTSGAKQPASASSKSHKSSTKPTSTTATTAVKTVQAAPPPTVTVGAKGSGAGYQGGHFTGNFFGP
jgi:hypothetical protein